MREMMGDPKALVPQIFNGEQHCGVRNVPSLFLVDPRFCATPLAPLASLGTLLVIVTSRVSHVTFFTFRQAYDGLLEACEQEGGLREFLKLPPAPAAAEAAE